MRKQLSRAAPLLLALAAAGCIDEAAVAPAAGDASATTPDRMILRHAWFEATLVPVPVERVQGLLPPGLTPVLTPGGDGVESTSRHAGLLVAAARMNVSTDGGATFRTVHETWIELLVEAEERLKDPEYGYEKVILAVMTDDPVSLATYSAWGIEARRAGTTFEPGSSAGALVLNGTSTRGDGWEVDLSIRTGAQHVVSGDSQRIRWFVAREGRLVNVLHANGTNYDAWMGEARVRLAGEGSPMESLAGEWVALGARQNAPGPGEWWPVGLPEGAKASKTGPLGSPPSAGSSDPPALALRPGPRGQA